ncbi:hypothetical protein EYC98_08575 [Halieaceae bacterium IMCC14734]|uniref:DUF2939 domain-containing protein n=1 Tax=Candidatus Litorirhabdus singularis TaxID=2518993 RepID=A0ABT3TF28_9GAMM|nr:hypothetical protein [Candidatus Litorirhabdus singularis]MCX2980917.1 hypothetical protein [Candidatus Litorirhabdus singularis]
MNRRLLLWLVPTALYAVFVTWYTDFGGPLTDAEVDTFVSSMQERGGDPELIARMETFFREDSGNQFLMLNAIDMNDNPPDVEGAEPGASAGELMGLYMEYMFPALLKRASHPVIYGDAVYSTIDLVGIEGAEQWTAGAIFRYRSRRTLMEIVGNPAMSERHEFKLAALDKTIAYPIETSLNPGDLRILFGLTLLALTALLDIACFGRHKQRA